MVCLIEKAVGGGDAGSGGLCVAGAEDTEQQYPKTAGVSIQTTVV